MDMMNVNSALSAVQMSGLSTGVSSVFSLKMLDNAIDMNEVMNDGMVKMMENSVTPYIGGNFDEYV